MSLAYFPGLHQPSDAWRFKRCCISIHRLQTRVKPLGCPEVFVDSGAFTTIDKHGGYPHGPKVYARRLWELHRKGIAEIAGAASQDFMCEQFVISKILGIDPEDLAPGLHRKMVRVHQEMTIARYDELMEGLCWFFDDDIPFPVLPVLQGYLPEEYRRQVAMYGDRLREGMWVGVGSVCKRNGSVADVIAVLSAIKDVRPDLRLHGFGLKKTAIKDPSVRAMLATADSMAWSDHARNHANEQHVALEQELGRKLQRSEVKEILLSRGITPRDGNSWREAMVFVEEVENHTDVIETAWQMGLPLNLEAAE